MIGSSGNISPNYYHTHEHEITKCLHETKGMKPESAGGMAAGRNTFSSLPMQKQDSFSLRELLVSGLQGLVSRAFGFWGKLGETKEQEKDVSGNNKEVRISADGGDGAHGTTALSAETGAANVLAAALIKPETRMEEIPEEEGRKVGNVEGAISGGLKSRKQFFRKAIWISLGKITASCWIPITGWGNIAHWRRTGAWRGIFGRKDRSFFPNSGVKIPVHK